uniref:Uncharacterized protein n=1 Tax=Panagrolaimus davidi TaxID=227884 RepID=A0A914QJP7_9BILA
MNKNASASENSSFTNSAFYENEKKVYELRRSAALSTTSSTASAASGMPNTRMAQNNSETMKYLPQFIVHRFGDEYISILTDSCQLKSKFKAKNGIIEHRYTISWIEEGPIHQEIDKMSLKIDGSLRSYHAEDLCLTTSSPSISNNSSGSSLPDSSTSYSSDTINEDEMQQSNDENNPKKDKTSAVIRSETPAFDYIDYIYDPTGRDLSFHASCESEFSDVETDCEIGTSSGNGSELSCYRCLIEAPKANITFKVANRNKDLIYEIAKCCSKMTREFSNYWNTVKKLKGERYELAKSVYGQLKKDRKFTPAQAKKINTEV